MNSLLPLAIGLIALLYAAVGHAGATGYIAVMALFGLPAATIRPTALVLNVIVATIATVQFARAGHFQPRLFWPLAVASVPCAFIGGTIDLPTTTLEMLLGTVLLVSAGRIVGELHRHDQTGAAADAPPAVAGKPVLLAGLGGAIGLLSGLTGVGGGVFLTPVLLALTAVLVKGIAAVTAAFILVNSLSGLAGGLVAGRLPPAAGLPMIAAAAIGGAVGSYLGAFMLPPRALRLLMAGVLLVASGKLLLRPLGM